MSRYKRQPKVAAQTAYGRIFLIPEILEAILLYLPSRDLLVSAIRVNHAWTAIMESSPRIQQALFFQSLPKNSNRAPEANSLLVDAFPAWFKDRGNESAQVMYWNLGSAECFESLDWNSSKEKRLAYARKEASWRRMLPVQPPAQTLEVVKYTNSMGGDYKGTGQVYFKDGIRMGALYDLAQREVARPHSGFGIKWHSLDGSEGGGDVSGLARLWNYLFGKSNHKVTMTVAWTVQCCVGRPGALGPEFKSHGYEDLKIRFESEKFAR